MARETKLDAMAKAAGFDCPATFLARELTRLEEPKRFAWKYGVSRNVVYVWMRMYQLAKITAYGRGRVKPFWFSPETLDDEPRIESDLEAIRQELGNVINQGDS